MVSLEVFKNWLQWLPGGQFSFTRCFVKYWVLHELSYSRTVKYTSLGFLHVYPWELLLEKTNSQSSLFSAFPNFFIILSLIGKCHHYHHHHLVMSPARISLTLSRRPSLSFIASGSSSGLHPVSSPSSSMYVRAGRPAFAQPCEGLHRSKSLMRSSLLLQQCPAYLVRLTLIVFVMGGLDA